MYASTAAHAAAKERREDNAAVIAGLVADDAKTNAAIESDANLLEGDVERIAAASALTDEQVAAILPGLTTSYTLGTVPRRAVADAGADGAAATGAVGVALDGSGSVAGSGALTYAWTQTAGEAVALSDPAAQSPTFTAPATAQTLTFQLEVTDDVTTSRPDTVDVVVS